MSSGSVVVLEAQSLTALTIARAIDRRYECIGVYQAECEGYPSLASNYWSSLVVAQALDHNLLIQLLELGQALFDAGGVKAVLLTATDDGVMFIAEHKQALVQHFHVPVPELDVVSCLMDKSDFYHWADGKGIPVIKTIVCESPDELAEVARNFLLPYILKPKVRGHLWNKQFPSDKILVVSSEDERQQFLEGTISKLFNMGGMLVQPLIPGGDDDIHFVLTSYDANGELLGYFSGRKLAQWPQGGGSTLVCVNSENEYLVSLTASIFSRLKISGLASIEFKKDSLTKKYYIVEPTVGRCDYQSLIAEYCGSNLVLRLVEAIYGRPMVSANRIVSRIWVDEFSFVRLIKLDFRSAIHVLKSIGFFNLWRVRLFLFDLKDIKPFFSLFKRIFIGRLKNKPKKL